MKKPPIRIEKKTTMDIEWTSAELDDLINGKLVQGGEPKYPSDEKEDGLPLSYIAAWDVIYRHLK
jgi:hypothetical protein